MSRSVASVDHAAGVGRPVTGPPAAGLPETGPPAAGQPAAPARRGRARWARWLSTLVGTGLAAGGTAFVLDKIVDGWSSYGDIVAGAQKGWLLAGLALAVAGMSAMGLVWWRVIVALGGTVTADRTATAGGAVSRRQVFVWYQFGNLGKYLPGGVWPLVGRSELAVRGGLDRAVAYNSVAVSMGATYLCAALVSAVLLPVVLLDHARLDAPLWTLAIAPVGLVVLHPAILGRLLRIAGRALGDGGSPVVPPWRTSVGLVLRHAPPWLAIGGATWLVARTFAPDAPVVPIVFAGIVSWVIGFVVIFVPGGIGVREAAFTAIAAVALPPEVAATVAIVSRLVFMLADALGVGLAGILALVAARRGEIATSPDRADIPRRAGEG